MSDLILKRNPLQKTSLIFNLFFIVIFSGIASVSFGNEASNEFLIVPLRGNTLDIHFVNITNTEVKITPSIASSKDIPAPDKRNLLFIPNSTMASGEKLMPLDLTLDKALITTLKGKPKLVVRKFIQSIMVCNNISSYSEQKKNYSYNSEGKFCPYSSYMWTNGTQTSDDGLHAYKNAMDEINTLKYSFNASVNEIRELNLELRFSAKSHIRTSQTNEVSAYIKRLTIINDTASHIAAITSLTAGILSIPTNPLSGSFSTVSGAAWEIQATVQTMMDHYNLQDRYDTEAKGHSWLSSPFDVIINPVNCFIKDRKTNVTYSAEADERNGQVTFYLGNDVKPQSIIFQFFTTNKGDLYIFIVSGSLLAKGELDKVLPGSEFTHLNKAGDIP
ncbi:MAG TPA: hypothetical protein DD381_10445 [Lentisphaeria bacterium]|nr:MAG: hypothetical protein A2X47_02225 [Lentisphaerae bacterium GWF2_38_69]HBM16745.1 hypothetical protein [Lentisphaeria bacterium]